MFGTRPEAIKLAPVILEMRRDARFECLVCSTGQHKEMLDQVTRVFGIQPDLELSSMEPDQPLAGLTARLLVAVSEGLEAFEPDLVIVQGDTTTALAATVAAFYQQIPVAHVEAGLRTGNMEAPWPEEANRRLISVLATLHFAPTERARANLLRDGVPDNNVLVTGNTVVDALRLALERLRKEPSLVTGLDDNVLRALRGRRLVLVTAHRRESFGTGLEHICKAIAELARRFPEVVFVYPVHMNPNVRKPVGELLRPLALRNLYLLEPLGYLSFVWLMERADLILTDSGGIQEEAVALSKPVLVMRESTERPEVIESGIGRLVGADCERIVREACSFLEGAVVGAFGRSQSNPYGDGHAATRIVSACARLLSF